MLGHLLQRSELLQPEAGSHMLQTVLENQIARRTFDDCSLAFLSRQGQRFGRWECLTPRQQAAIFGVTTPRTKAAGGISYGSSGSHWRRKAFGSKSLADGIVKASRKVALHFERAIFAQASGNVGSNW